VHHVKIRVIQGELMKVSQVSKVCFVLIAAVASASVVEAADAPAPAAGTTTATASESASALDSLHLDLFSIFHGPTVSDMGSPYGVNNAGKVSSRNPLLFDSELTAAYMPTSDVGIGPVLPFLLFPVMGKGFVLGDAGIKAFDRHAISSGGLNVYTNLIVQAATSDSSKARNMSWALKTTPNFRYKFHASRVSVGAWTEAKAYFGVTKDKTFKLYGAPYVAYRVSPSVALNLEYEMEAHHDVGKPSLDFANYQTDLMPGIVWNITPHVLVNPYVQLFTGNKVNTDSMALGAVISATVL
jgi:hypothetical protein